ncbi:MAG: hypothetical protein DWQ01_19965 [Planctomycetota bacterium]|nr:MAG: hypothetical protein DWQ01_19965 [Planctomycetota bacterium]
MDRELQKRAQVRPSLWQEIQEVAILRLFPTRRNLPKSAMGKQYNKVEKRKRRQRRMKRLKQKQKQARGDKS